MRESMVQRVSQSARSAFEDYQVLIVTYDTGLVLKLSHHTILLPPSAVVFCGGLRGLVRTGHAAGHSALRAEVVIGGNAHLGRRRHDGRCLIHLSGLHFCVLASRTHTLDLRT